jgi:hypothetical protein
VAFTSQRTDFQTIEFTRAIQNYGYFCVWEKATQCSCISLDKDGQPDFNCPACFGKGKIWYDPKDIQGVMVSFTENERYQQNGEILAGTTYFTTFPENRLGFWDRITHDHSTIRYSEIIKKGTYGKTDKFRFKPVEISQVRTVSKVYSEETDYLFDFDTGTINWVSSGYEPMTGEQYSVDYFMRPSWIVIDIPNVIRDTMTKRKQPGVSHTQLPMRVVMRLEYFVIP